METKQKNKLPVLKDLYEGDLPLKNEQNKLNVLLNQPPAPAWVKNHPFAKGVKYIPIERIEYLLTRLFIKWKVEVKTIQTIANSCVVTVRLHYQNIEDKGCADGGGSSGDSLVGGFVGRRDFCCVLGDGLGGGVIGRDDLCGVLGDG